MNEASSLYEKALASLLENQKEVTLINEEWFLPQPKLVILGAGHVSQYVSKLASMLDFYTIVIDERKEFACKELFQKQMKLIVFLLIKLIPIFLRKQIYVMSL